MPFPSGNHLFSVSVTVSVFCLFVWSCVLHILRYLVFWRERTFLIGFLCSICFGWFGSWICFCRSFQSRIRSHLVLKNYLPTASVPFVTRWIIRLWRHMWPQRPKRHIRCLLFGAFWSRLSAYCIIAMWLAGQACLWSRYAFMCAIWFVCWFGVRSDWSWRTNAVRPAVSSIGIIWWCFLRWSLLAVFMQRPLWFWRFWRGLFGRSALCCIPNGSGKWPMCRWSAQNVRISSVPSIAKN